MRIVDYETFIRMPSGTIFAPWTPCTTLEEPEIKVDHGWEYTDDMEKHDRWVTINLMPEGMLSVNVYPWSSKEEEEEAEE